MNILCFSYFYTIFNFIFDQEYKEIMVTAILKLNQLTFLCFGKGVLPISMSVQQLLRLGNYN